MSGPTTSWATESLEQRSYDAMTRPPDPLGHPCLLIKVRRPDSYLCKRAANIMRVLEVDGEERAKQSKIRDGKQNNLWRQERGGGARVGTV